MVAKKSSRSEPSQFLTPEAFAPFDACTSPAGTARVPSRQIRASRPSPASGGEARKPRRHFVECGFIGGNSVSVLDRRNSMGEEGSRPCHEDLPRQPIIYCTDLYFKGM